MNHEKLQHIKTTLHQLRTNSGGVAQARNEAVAMIVAELAKPEAPQRGWTLLLTGENCGLVGKLGEKFDSSPSHYDRVDVYTKSPARPLIGLDADDIMKLPGFDYDAALKEKNHG